jgi:ligand-binding sensor domain-containing protein/serine phosphatase RsbU (regulator of sigma subunit)
MRQKRLYIILCIVGLWLKAWALHAQPLEFLEAKAFGLKEGLSQSQANVILQDRRGFIWIGTDDGLNLYDGYVFKVFRQQRDDTTSIADNRVKTILETRDGQLWFGTHSGGLSKFDRQSRTFANFLISQDNNRLNYVYSIAEAPNGMFWLGTEGGVCVYDPKKKQLVKVYSDKSHGIEELSAQTRKVYVDKEGTFWCAINHTLYRFDAATDRLQQLADVPSNFKGLHPIVRIENFYDDGKGSLWLSTWGHGLCRLDKRSKAITAHPMIRPDGQPVYKAYASVADNYGFLWVSDSLGFRPFHIEQQKYWTIVSPKAEVQALANLGGGANCAMLDRDGTLWFGTRLGVHQLYRNTKRFRLLQHDPNRPDSLLVQPSVASVGTDRYGNVWLGSSKGLTLYKPSELGKKLPLYAANPSVEHNPTRASVITCIYESPDGVLYVGTGMGPRIVDRKTGKFSRLPGDTTSVASEINTFVNTFAIRQDRNRHLWIGTSKGMFQYHLDQQKILRFYAKIEGDSTSLSHNTVRYILEDRKGRLWISTTEGGLNLFNPEKGTFKHYIHSPKDKTTISSNAARCILEDRQGKLWITTYGGGLNLFDPDKGIFKAFTETEGLCNNAVYGVLEDAQGYLWLSTNKGLAKFNPRNNTIRNYYHFDGLQSNEFNGNAYAKGIDGKLYFGGIEGLTYFHPDSIADNTQPARVVLTAFQKMNHDADREHHISEQSEITLSYKDYMFSFEFAALTFRDADRNQYAYMMEGFDNDWNYIGNRRVIYFTNLDPGTYTLLIKASNADNIWNSEPMKLKVIILPPWWGTWWARTLAVLLVAAILYAAYLNRLNRIKEQKRELEKQVQERTAEILIQKEEIASQRDNLVKLNEELKESKVEIEHRNLALNEKSDALREALSEIEVKNQAITSSIQYAKRIQAAMLPVADRIAQSIPEHFIFFRPRDIVSGDFYWFAEQDNRLIFAVVDCTGHGVPGAFMSMIGDSMLNQYVLDKNITSPGRILEMMNQGIRQALKQDISENRDGMDMALISIDKTARTITFAGAHNPVVYVQPDADGQPQLHLIKGERRSIGGFHKENAGAFNEHIIRWDSPTTVYLFSDGFQDQVGGEHHRKLMARQFRELLLGISQTPMQTQHQLLEQYLRKWSGNHAQVDDILVVGLRLT